MKCFVTKCSFVPTGISIAGSSVMKTRDSRSTRKVEPRSGLEHEHNTVLQQLRNEAQVPWACSVP